MKKGDCVRLNFSQFRWNGYQEFNGTVGKIHYIYADPDRPMIVVEPIMYSSKLQLTLNPGFLTVLRHDFVIISEEEYEQELIAYLLQK